MRNWIEAVKGLVKTIPRLNLRGTARGLEVDAYFKNDA